MSNYRRVRVPGHYYFFTVVTYQRCPIFRDEDRCSRVIQLIKEETDTVGIRLHAWVVLPDHLHCIWEMPQIHSDYSRAWAKIKLRFTKSMKDEVANLPAPSASRAKRSDGSVWQKRFWEHTIRNEDELKAYIAYIHYNPVKHGFVPSAKDWRHSSFQEFVGAGLCEEDWGGIAEWPAEIGSE